MSFIIDPKWSKEELKLYRERFDLKGIMDKCYKDDPERYANLAKRYHEINKILGDDDYKC